MNDTQRKQVEAVRERLRGYLAEYKQHHCPPDSTEMICADLKSCCGLCWAIAILNDPDIAILDEKQNLPAYYARNNIYRIIPPDKKSQKDGGE